jgi:lipid-A-disaccharide synthase-like uncharacterized protein
MSSPWFWLAIGFLGRALFCRRPSGAMGAQERKHHSVVPLAFCLGGGLTLLIYAIHWQDSVFIIGQSSGLFINARNLILIHGERRREVRGVTD